MTLTGEEAGTKTLRLQGQGTQLPRTRRWSRPVYGSHPHPEGLEEGVVCYVTGEQPTSGNIIIGQYRPKYRITGKIPQ
jgi:hypothetical protein